MSTQVDVNPVADVPTYVPAPLANITNYVAQHPTVAWAAKTRTGTALVSAVKKTATLAIDELDKHEALKSKVVASVEYTTDKVNNTVEYTRATVGATQERVMSSVDYTKSTINATKRTSVELYNNCDYEHLKGLAHTVVDKSKGASLSVIDNALTKVDTTVGSWLGAESADEGVVVDENGKPAIIGVSDVVAKDSLPHVYAHASNTTRRLRRGLWRLRVRALDTVAKTTATAATTVAAPVTKVVDSVAAASNKAVSTALGPVLVAVDCVTNTKGASEPKIDSVDALRRRLRDTISTLSSSRRDGIRTGVNGIRKMPAKLNRRARKLTLWMLTGAATTSSNLASHPVIASSTDRALALVNQQVKTHPALAHRVVDPAIEVSTRLWSAANEWANEEVPIPTDVELDASNSDDTPSTVLKGISEANEATSPQVNKAVDQRMRPLEAAVVVVDTAVEETVSSDVSPAKAKKSKKKKNKNDGNNEAASVEHVHSD